MKKLLLTIVLSIAALAACEHESPQNAEQSATKSKTDFSGYVEKGIEYDVNEKGVLIFMKARDMFDNFNDYREEEGEVKFITEKPLSILITKKLEEDEKQLSKEYAEMSFLYAIYRTFMNTPETQVTVEAYPIVVTRKNKEIPQKKVALKTTITREKALDVLQKYTNAKSIDDLVQTEENTEHRKVGISGSKIWDKFIYNEKERSNIVADLVN